MERQRIQREVRVARAGVEANASAVVDQIGAVLGISKDDLIWAFGQVLPIFAKCGGGCFAWLERGGGKPRMAVPAFLLQPRPCWSSGIACG